MTRLGIVSIFDVDGKIYPYLEYYLYELSKVLNSMIIISNGMLRIEEKEKLKRFTERVYERENIGYDAGAYKYVMRKYISEKEWNTFDEIVLSNDTCFGPLKSFEDIFSEMDYKGNFDLWGINALNSGFFKYIQSNFIVIKRGAFTILKEYFEKYINEHASTKHDVCINFETGLYLKLIRNGFKAGSYIEYNDVDPYNSSFYLAKDYKCPLIKKNADIKKYTQNMLYLIDYIKENTYYDSSLIEEYYNEKFNVVLKNYNKENVLPHYMHVSFTVGEADINKFICQNKKIYVYGIGKIAEYFMQYFEDKISNLNGFIVSDDKYNLEFYSQYKVYKISEISDRTTAIIVALNRKNTDEVKKNLQNYTNILYLSK